MYLCGYVKIVDVIFAPACKTCQQITVVAAWVLSGCAVCDGAQLWQQPVICSASLFLSQFEIFKATCGAEQLLLTGFR